MKVKSPIDDHGSTSRKLVYHAAARWRAFAFLFPVLGVALLVFLLCVTWADGIESGDLHLIAVVLAIGLPFATFCVLVFRWIFWGIRLVITREGIAYASGGLLIYTTWNDVLAVDDKMLGSSRERGLLLGNPVLRVRGLSGWLSLFGMAAAPRTNRQALANFASTRIAMPPIDPDAYVRFIL